MAPNPQPSFGKVAPSPPHPKPSLLMGQQGGLRGTCPLRQNLVEALEYEHTHTRLGCGQNHAARIFRCTPALVPVFPT